MEVGTMANTPLHMTSDQYITQRVEQYQSWYDNKAVRSKKIYLRMRALSVIGGGLVPVLVNIPWNASLGGITITQALVTIIGLIVVIIVSLESVFHYREQWKNYRSTEQFLGHEKIMFRSKVGRYKNLSEDDSFQLFVERIEEAIASENAATLNVMAVAIESVEKKK